MPRRTDNGGSGRGSAAGSLVSYCLGITNINPLKYGLIFERFLNPERISMPTLISISAMNGGRRYRLRSGEARKDRVAQIITFGTMPPGRR